MKTVYSPAGMALPPMTSADFRQEPRRDVRAGTPDRGAVGERVGEIRGAEEITPALDRPAVFDLDPFSADIAASRVVVARLFGWPNCLAGSRSVHPAEPERSGRGRQPRRAPPPRQSEPTSCPEYAIGPEGGSTRRNHLTWQPKRPRLHVNRAAFLGRRETRMNRHSRALFGGVLALGLLGAAYLAIPSAQAPSRRGTANGEWRYLGGDAGHTRYSPLNQMTPANFETLKEAWRFSPLDVVGPMTARATPSYVGGKLLSVAGPRRHVVSMDPDDRQAAVELRRAGDVPVEVLDARRLRQGRGLPRDQRHAASSTSPRRASSCSRSTPRPASRSRTGDGRCGSPAFPRTGVVDLVEDLIRDWEPWTKLKQRLRRRTRACRSSSATSPAPRRRSSSTTW